MLHFAGRPWAFAMAWRKAQHAQSWLDANWVAGLVQDSPTAGGIYEVVFEYIAKDEEERLKVALASMYVRAEAPQVLHSKTR